MTQEPFRARHYLTDGLTRAPGRRNKKRRPDGPDRVFIVNDSDGGWWASWQSGKRSADGPLDEIVTADKESAIAWALTKVPAIHCYIHDGAPYDGYRRLDPGV